ncbi:magnesium transporter CorA family protein [Clostridium oryzae]|uniref:Magnesium transport protein CorA n=1 Tax=Clostridium oryzae TaxID=1450648 RepID=A0A1V4IIA3_9CLOT|nr:magnesium transporter CorA family protein [Clostridium oryzae]OPJ59580.1 magnesium transport protein CorA [Clostridium oryzae]
MEIYDIANNFSSVTGDWNLGDNYYWILCNAEELNILNKKIKMDTETLEECKSLRQSAKIVFFADYIFMVFNVLEFNENEIVSRELNIYLGKTYIVTVYKNNPHILHDILKDIEQGKNCFILKKNPRPCIMLYYILDSIIVRNYNIVSGLEAAADKIEISILKQPKTEHGHQLIVFRRQLYRIRKFLNPLKYIGDSLVINENKIIEEEYIEYFKSINIKIGKLMQTEENLIQTLALVREAYESEISNKTNELMKIFATIASIFLPIEIITAIFGMNFEWQPLKHSHYGFYVVLFFMIVVVIVIVKVFKRNKWL